MMTRFVILTLMTLAFFNFSPTTRGDDAGEWISLFDGKSLDGWSVYHEKWKPDRGWVVEDGALYLKNPIGFVRGTNLISDEQFDNFELEFDWKVSKAANSGVMYLVRPGDAAPFLSGPEYQILDDASWNLSPKVLAASMYDVIAAKGKRLKPTGEWNHGRIVLDNNHLEHWLNGAKVLEIELHGDEWDKCVTDSKFRDSKEFAARRKGHIALQDHGYRVWYRNIRIRRLPAKMPRPQSPTLMSDGWILTADVECGNAAWIERIGKDHFALAPREDPLPIEVQMAGPISNYSLYVAITNDRPERRRIELDVVIPAWLIEHGFDYFLKKHYMVRPVANLQWEPIPANKQRDGKDRVHLSVDFASGERKVVSTTAVYPYSLAVAKLKQLAKASDGRARVVEIGRSLEDRPILSLEAGHPGRPRVVFASSLQPGEPGAWAILSMAEEIVSRRSEYLADFNLAFIPITNPDGVVRGLCNVNSKGEIAMLGFRDIAAGRPGPHEAEVLWKYLKKEPPVAFIDFHFLRLPNHRIPSVYVFEPSLYTDTGRRDLAEKQARGLESLSGIPPRSPIKRDHPMWQRLATFNSIVEWNTVANLYQYTGPKTSHKKAQTRGVEVMQTVLDTMR